MVMDMRLSAMLLLDVTVRDVYVLHLGMVVLVHVGGQQVPPVLAAMQVVRHVKVLVTVLDGLVLMTPRLRHQLPPSHWPSGSSSDRTPSYAPARWSHEVGRSLAAELLVRRPITQGKPRRGGQAPEPFPSRIGHVVLGFSPPVQRRQPGFHVNLPLGC